MKKIALVLATALNLTAAGSAWAGSASAELKCKSGSGRTTLDASIQDIDAIFETARLTIDGETLSYTGLDHVDESGSTRRSRMGADACNTQDEEQIFASLGDGIFVMKIMQDRAAENAYRSFDYFELVGLPKTFRNLSSHRNRTHVKFQARLNGTDPRAERRARDEFAPEITLSCELIYEL